MTEQAMTSAEGLEERPIQDSTDSGETAGDSIGDTMATEERTSDEDSFTTDVDITKLAPELQEHARSLEKQFKSAYTRKRQEESARLKYAEHTQQQLNQQLDTYKKNWQAVLDDPSKFEAYRQVYGHPVKKEQEPQHFETVQDLMNHFENKIETLKTEMDRKVEERVNSNLSSYEIQSRWDNVDETRAVKDPNYSRYRKLVHNEIRSNPDYYKGMYAGNNENDILSIALKNVMEAVTPVLSEAKAKTQQSLEKKKSASTLSASRSPTSTRPLTVEEQIIEEARAKFGRISFTD